jgi:hypothetical protein
MSEYTPGPWRTSKPQELFGGVWADRIEIADVASNSLPTEEQRANARLIAAAPDMLAALKAMHDHAVEYARINNLFNSDGSPATFHELLQARAAIAKAEGKS